ncbi:MAG: hypothetical protein HZA32_08805 [Opitutae bacterium]|nr:hypothetical protein [Opitutae bacterium]
MLTGLTQWLARRPATSGAYADAFVRGVAVEEPRTPRDPRLMRFILICWLLIAVKHVAVIWAVHHYHMPFHQLIVNFPTWLIGTVATTLYLQRTR